MAERLFDKRQDPYFRVENAAIEREDLDIYEKMVYFVLCRYANNNDGAFPSYETIAKRASISRTTAIRTIKRLVEKNLVEKEIRLKENSCENTSNVYYVLSANNKKEGSVSQTPPSITQTPRVVSDRYPKKNYIKNNYNKNKSSSTKLTDDELSFKKYFEEKTEAKITNKKVKELVSTIGYQKLIWELEEFLRNTKHQLLKNITGAFISYLKGDFTPAIKQDSKLSNKDNFTERKYDSDDFERFYKQYDE